MAQQVTAPGPSRAGDAGFERLALALIVVTLLVIAWGAFVRVTGSGAGCADHWPLCNGEFIPRTQRVATWIEYTHRLTSGLCGLLSVAVFWLARRRFASGSPVRHAALAGLLLMGLEGAIGALLVKKGLVATDASEARAFVVALHLCNTFLLLGAQVLTLRFARDPSPLAMRERPGLSAGLLALLLLCVLLGASGAVTALGDTLFPARSLQHGMAQDFAKDAHFLVRLRVFHPLLAVLVGALVVFVAQSLGARLGCPQVARSARVLTVLFGVELAVGSLNLWLLAPTAVQLAHLFLADLTFIALVWFFAAALAARVHRELP